jgi:peptide chain release factor 2
MAQSSALICGQSLSSKKRCFSRMHSSVVGATAMNMLKARLYEAELAKREAVTAGEYQAKTEIGWGHQIRSYVLQPYQLVKDLRTGVTSTAPDDVLDGALDPFMAAALSQRVSGEKVTVEDVD